MRTFRGAPPYGARLARPFAGLLAATGVLLALPAQSETLHLSEATIAQLQKAMESGALSSVELTVLSLNRLYAYDANGVRLNAVPVLNPYVLEEAAAADRRRAEGGSVSPLLGIPYTVKDSYKVKGLTVAGGSPAFAHLVANEDAFTVQRIRAAGGVLIGKTNMPPLANGGMQRGVYGRAESPYNGEYLTAAWASGSSNGSATATTSSFAVFGMGEETVSSGRSPASNNGLVAYTPSRGVISIRGNWPLFPMRDVVVPHTRTVPDLFALLDVIVADDPITEGDFWRNQRVVKLPAASSVRPASYTSLANRSSLRGKRIGVPTMYLGKDASMKDPIVVRPSILALWQKAAADLRAQGATVIEIDFEPMHSYEADRPGARSVVERGLMPPEWWFSFGPNAVRNSELSDLSPYAYEMFLQSCRDPAFPSWRVIDASQVFPDPPGSVEAHGRGLPHGYAETKAAIVAGVKKPESLPHFAAALEGVERLRKTEFEEWMKKNRLDAVVFPANADVGKADTDVNEASYGDANRNGVRFSNMNHAIRHLGIPSVSVTMGVMSDTHLPVNLTFIGAAYSDNALLSYAYAYEQATHNRQPPTRVPPLADETIEYRPDAVVPPVKRGDKTPPEATISNEVQIGNSSSGNVVRFSGTARDAGGLSEVRLYVSGHKVPVTGDAQWRAEVPVSDFDRWALSDAARVAVLVLVKDRAGNASARLEQLDLTRFIGGQSK